MENKEQLLDKVFDFLCSLNHEMLFIETFSKLVANM